jgi:hypothetical protein
MSVTVISLGAQQSITGIAVPVTVTSGSNPGFITASFSDQIHNTNPAIVKTISNFVANPDGTWSAEAVLSESEMLALFSNEDFKNKVRLAVYKGAVNAISSNLEWHDVVSLLAATGVAGAEQVTINVSLDPNYINSGLTAQVIYSTAGSPSSATMASIALTAVVVNSVNSLTNFTGVLTGLTYGQTYEIQLSVENAYGSSNTITLETVMTSYNPGNVSIDSFDSLDVSGALFDFTVAAFDYSTYTSLKLLIDFKTTADASIGAQQTLVIDICGTSNILAPNASRSFDIDRYLMSSSNKTAIAANSSFKINAQLEAVIDISGLVRTYISPVATRTYIMDANMTAPAVTLSEIDWVSGSQTVQAVIDGCFNNLTFTFDLSGAQSTTTTYDICGTTQKMTASKIYNYNELNAVGKAVNVSASRPELNGGASLSTSGPTALGFDLKAIKRAAAPTVAITNVTASNVEFNFTALPDVSFSEVYAVISGSDDLVFGNAVIVDGIANIVLTGTFEAGERYVSSGYTIYNMNSASFDARYVALNAGANQLLSIATSSQSLFTGDITLNLSVRPATTNSNVLNAVRLSGDMNANRVQELVCFAKDVCGNLLEQRLVVTDATNDSCGNNLSGNTLTDNARTFAHDFVFNAEIEIASGMFVIGIVDTPDALDAVTVKQTSATVANAFKSAATAFNAAVAANTVAQDLSNNPANDTAYAAAVQAIVNYDISFAQLTTDISNAIIIRDGSANGSDWFKAEAVAFADRRAVEQVNASFNLDTIGQAISIFDTSYANAATASERVDLQLSTVIIPQKTYYSSNDDASMSNVTFAGSSTTYLEILLDNFYAVKYPAYNTSITNKDNADTASTAAADANTANNDLLAAKQTALAALPARSGLVTTRDNRNAALVSAAGATAGTLVTKTSDLATARLAFFPAPVVV